MGLTNLGGSHGRSRAGSSQPVQVNVTVTQEKPARANVDPNPACFRILSARIKRGHILAEILYPNCTNFEGRKIILFKGVSIHNITKMDYLDPHFSEKGNIIARFSPSIEGILLAKHVFDSL